MLSMKIVAAKRMKLNKLRKHLGAAYAECVGKTSEFFRRKLNVFNKLKQAFVRIATVIPKPLLSSFKFARRIAKCKIHRSHGESLMLPAAIDTVETKLGELYAKILR